MSKQFENELKDLLDSLSFGVLYDICKSIGGGLLKDKINTKEDAVENILRYSPDVDNIFKRKNITKVMLFDYCHYKHIDININCTKTSLVDAIKDYWRKHPTSSIVHHIEYPQDDINDVSHSELDMVHCSPSPSHFEIAYKFAEWFYNMLNVEQYIGVEHFYADAKLKLNIFSNSDTNTQYAETPSEIVKVIGDTKCMHQLVFNPNLSAEGVQGIMNPHGLLVVTVRGTMHIENQCVGVYDQSFGLAKDPFASNNWKIKFTEMNLGRQSNKQIELTDVS